MSSLNKTKRIISQIHPGISVREDRGCIVLEGEVEDWALAVKAGKAAVDKKKYLGVINNITLKGFIPNERIPSLRDSALEGYAPDVLIIGGGITGCAAARELARWKTDILLIEKGSDVAVGASSRNGGVVHVGIDYSGKSQKSLYNNRGNAMYDQLCSELNVPFEHKGQVMLIAAKWERLILPLLKMNAKAVGIPGVRYLPREKLKEIEPELPSWAIGGLYMPTGGIVCPHKLTVACAENAVRNGAHISLETAALSMDVKDGKIISVMTNRGRVYPKMVINAAGVYSDVIADMAGDRTFTIHPRKGTDIILDKKTGSCVKTSMAGAPWTIVPSRNTPRPKGLIGTVKAVLDGLSSKSHTKGGGVIHTTDGNVIIGPNVVETPDREDITTSLLTMEAILEKQLAVAERVTKNDVIAYFSGLRACTYEEDFNVRKGIFTENILEAAGIQSPGITASPAIAVALTKWAVEYLSRFGTVQPNAEFDPIRRPVPHLASMTPEMRAEWIAKNPDYGEIVCRCEEVSKGEILDAMRSPLPVYTLDAIKRRVRPGMGRCQGGFCGPLVLDIIAKEKGCSPEEITKSGKGSEILAGATKKA